MGCKVAARPAAFGMVLYFVIDTSVSCKYPCCASFNLALSFYHKKTAGARFIFSAFPGTAFSEPAECCQRQKAAVFRKGGMPHQSDGSCSSGKVAKFFLFFPPCRAIRTAETAETNGTVRITPSVPDSPCKISMPIAYIFIICRYGML